jgi:hypothetical protein
VAKRNSTCSFTLSEESEKYALVQADLGIHGRELQNEGFNSCYYLQNIRVGEICSTRGKMINSYESRKTRTEETGVRKNNIKVEIKEDVKMRTRLKLAQR